MIRTRALTLTAAGALLASAGAATAAPAPTPPPPLTVIVDGKELRVPSSAYLWKGVIADSIPTGQQRGLASLPVRAGGTVRIRVGFGAQTITVSEVVRGKLKGTTVTRGSDTRTLSWAPRLPKGAANVEIFVKTRAGFASYVLELRRS